MHQCLGEYPGHATQDIFQSSIVDSPRLVWAPGTTARRLHVVWSSTPDLASTGEMCDASGPSNCSALSLAQISGYLLPTEAVPEGSIPPFPGADTAFGATLFR